MEMTVQGGSQTVISGDPTVSGLVANSFVNVTLFSSHHAPPGLISGLRLTVLLHQLLEGCWQPMLAFTMDLSETLWYSSASLLLLCRDSGLNPPLRVRILEWAHYT